MSMLKMRFMHNCTGFFSRTTVFFNIQALAILLNSQPALLFGVINT